MRSIAVALIVAVFPLVAAAGDLAKLHAQVTTWRQHATQDRLDRVTRIEAHLAECTSNVLAEDPAKGTSVGVQIGEDEYQFTTLDVGEDRFCIYMMLPVNRPLSLSEAIDLEDALVMAPDLPIPPKVYSREEIRAAEAHLADLLTAVRKGDNEPLDKRHPPSPLDVADIVDCSHVNAQDAKIGGGGLQYIYNYYYSWVVVPREQGKHCIYLSAPFDRGLNTADGTDFMMAQQLRLIPRRPDAPNLERTVKAALERFGGGPAIADEPLPANLIDCTDFDREPGDSQDDYSDGGYAWLFDGSYSFTYFHLPRGTCLFVSNEEDRRGLLATEARAMIRAARADVDDPAHEAMQRSQNCFARADQSKAANVPGYEEGTINGRRYRVFYAPLDPDLARLDSAQHAFAASRKEAWAKSPPARGSQGAFDFELRFRTFGRTNRLAKLEGWQAIPGGAGPPTSKNDWLLHVPSGRFLTFEDLFVKPDVIHEEIAARFLENLPRYLESSMSMRTFIGDDAEQQERDFRARFLSEARRIAETPVTHFAYVMIAATGERAPYFAGDFSTNLLPDGQPAVWSAELKDLAPELKPEFRDVLDGVVCPRPSST